MNKEQLAQINQLSREEKWKLAQKLWDDLAKQPDDIVIPAEHRRVLNERLEKINSGQASFRSWEEIQAKYKSA